MENQKIFIIILLDLFIILFLMKHIKFITKIYKKSLLINFSNKTKISFKNIYLNKSEKFCKKNYIGKHLIFHKNKINLINIKNEVNSYLHLKKEDIKNNYFNKSKDPKISLIITLFNQKNFIPLVYSSILNQSFQDIEIIFIDDGSIDKPYHILKKYIDKDKRIIYKNNKINKGAFYSRNKGVKFAKGEYVLIIDADDLIINDILKKLYETAKKYNLDILQFYMTIGTVKKFRIWKKMKYKSGILCQPKIKDIFYYGKTRNIADKFIKREIFLKSINFMNEKFRKESYFFHDDDVAFYGLIKVCNSYGFLENIGYFYRRDNPKSRSHIYLSSNNVNRLFRSLFSIMKYYFEQSDDNNLEKNLIAYNFFKVKVNNHIKKINKLTGEFEYIINILNLYLKCPFFEQEQKNELSLFKEKIEIRRKILSNKNLNF